MKLNKFAYLYSKPLGNHTLKIMKKYLELYLKTWKNHRNIMEFCQSEKVGTLSIDFKGSVSFGSLVFQNSSYYWSFGCYVSYYVNHPLYTPSQ